MPESSGRSARSQHDARVSERLLALLLAALGLIAFHGSLDVPFLFDDEPAIETNPRIERLWPFGSTELRHSTESGRPVVELSLSANYALGELELGAGPLARGLRALGLGAGGRNPRGYHVFNLLVHVLSGLVLFALVRRTLALPGETLARWRGTATPLAFTIAALWLVHPLQVDAVTYVIQRTELLMGFFCLATLYAALAAAHGERPRLWATLSVLACALGMASKEAMAAAPLLVLFYDRAFLFPSWRAAWKERRGLYVGLAGTWVILAWIVAANPRGASVGFGLGVPWWRYGATQLVMIAHYLRLVFWPTELCLDYGRHLADSAREIVPAALVVVPLLVGTLWALARRPRLGFLGAWFFGILAPSSSIVPILTEVGAERRMHLPLASVLVVVVLALQAGALRLLARSPRARLVLLPVPFVLVALLGVLTVRRNVVFQSDLTIWQDAVAKRPGNPSSHNNLGRAYAKRGRHEEALQQYLLAIQTPVVDGGTYMNLGQALADLGRGDEAIAFFLSVLRDNPGSARAHEGLARAYMSRERWAEASAEYRRALAAGPESAGLHNDLARCLFRAGQAEEAERHLLRALALDPEHALAAENLAKIRALAGPPAVR